MKKTNLFKIFAACTVLIMASCTTEPIDSSFTATDNGGGNNGGGNNGGGGTSSGDYWPMAINNEWQYTSTEPQNDQPMKIEAIETINNKQYYRINRAFQGSGDQQVSGTAVVHLRKENGAYFQRVSVTVPDQDGISVSSSPYEILILKDNLDVNGTWNGVAVQNFTYSVEDLPSISTNIEYKGTIMEKGITFNVQNQSYSNVIKIKYEQDISVTMDNLPVGSEMHTTTYIWFAQNVGPIKSETVNTTGATEYYMDLISYTLH